MTMKITDLIAAVIGQANPAAGAALTLSLHEFEKPEPQHTEMIRETLMELISGGLENIDTMFIVGLMKNKEGKVCDECGGVHDNSVELFTMAMGDQMLVQAAIITGLETVNKKHDEEAALSAAKEGMTPH